jgi:hypothetical protein
MSMDKQNELLRLIVQKMEIRAESEECQAGFEEDRDMSSSTAMGAQWSRSCNDVRNMTG